MNPKIPSHISALVTVVNFELSSAITRDILAAAVFAASDPKGYLRPRKTCCYTQESSSFPHSSVSLYLPHYHPLSLTFSAPKILVGTEKHDVFARNLAPDMR